MATSDGHGLPADSLACLDETPHGATDAGPPPSEMSLDRLRHCDDRARLDCAADKKARNATEHCNADPAVTRPGMPVRLEAFERVLRDVDPVEDGLRFSKR